MWNMRYALTLLIALISTFTWGQIQLSGTLKTNGNEPIENALVRLADHLTSSDKDGYFVMDLDSVGLYRLEIKSIGYKDLITTLQVSGPDHHPFILEEEIYNLESVELISSWIKPNQPFTYTNVSGDKIEQKNMGQDVPFLLRWTPSTVVTSDAGTGIGYSGIRVRGSDPSRINVTIDGIPLNDAESQGVFWVDLPDFASSVDAIQIQRGVGTSTHGAGAFGGTINLKTDGVIKDPYVNVSGSVGSFETISGKIEMGTGLLNNHFIMDGRISKVSSAGYIDRGSSDLNSLYLSGKYIGQNQSIKINYFTGKEITYQAWNGVPAQYINDTDLRTYNTAGIKADGSFHDDEVDNYRQSHLHIIYNRAFSKSIHGKAALHYTKGKGYFEQYRVEDVLSDYKLRPVHIGDTSIQSTDLIRRRWLDNDFLGGIFSIHLDPNRHFQLNAGGGWNRYWGNHYGEVIWARFMGAGEQNHEYYRDEARKDDANLYLQIQHDLSSRWSAMLDLQGRAVQYNFLGYNEQLEPSDTNESLFFFNPKFGLTYKTNNLFWYYSISIAHREPNRDDYVNSTLRSRPDAELLKDHELGIRKNWTRMMLSLNGYYMDYKNQLILTGKINDVGEYIRANVDKSYRAGLELEFQHVPTNRFQWYGSTTLSSNRIKSFKEYIDNWDTWEQESVIHKNTHISFSPSILVQAGFTYDLMKKPKYILTAEWLAKHVGKQYLDNTTNDRSSLDPYIFSDLHFRLVMKPKWTKELNLKFVIRNLFDQQVISNGWTYRYRSENYDGRLNDPYITLEGGSIYNQTGFYPQAGINFLVGISVKY